MPASSKNGTVYFSAQLSGWIGHLLFLLTVVLTIASLLGGFNGFQLALLPILLLIAGYTLLGTIGWRRVMKSQSEQSVYRYFLAQFVLIALLMVIELAAGITGTGLSTSILGIGLVLQSAVLPVRIRFWLFVALVALAALLYTPNMRVSLLNIPQIVQYIALFGLIYSVGFFLGLLIVREERARETSRRLDESNRKLALYAAEVETLSTLRERNRLAREIHDNLGHYLTAINMQLEVAMTHLSPGEEAASAALHKAQNLTKEALSEVRRSISAMRATPLEGRSLSEAITLLVEEHCATGHTANFRVVGTAYPCSTVIETTLYRIAQEGLTNIRKHAHEQMADLTLTYTNPELVSLDIFDDGSGSDGSDGGFGLLGIRERIVLLGGTMTINTAKGHGFALHVTLPV
jgi:signal transduction histidine kinase